MPEPTSYEVANPARVVAAQQRFVAFPPDGRWQPLQPGARSGIVLLRDTRPGALFTGFSIDALWSRVGRVAATVSCMLARGHSGAASAALAACSVVMFTLPPAVGETFCIWTGRLAASSGVRAEVAVLALWSLSAWKISIKRQNKQNDVTNFLFFNMLIFEFLLRKWSFPP